MRPTDKAVLLPAARPWKVPVPVRLKLPELIPEPGAVGRPKGPGNCSFLAKGRDKSHRRPRVLHLGGLCGPESAKRSWLYSQNAGKRPATVPVLV